MSFPWHNGVEARRWAGGRVYQELHGTNSIGGDAIRRVAETEKQHSRPGGLVLRSLEKGTLAEQMEMG